jgi:hypothetical protein
VFGHTHTNNVEAYFWMVIATAGMTGEQQERESNDRDAVAALLRPKEISKAQERATKWFAAHPPEP